MHWLLFTLTNDINDKLKSIINEVYLEKESKAYTINNCNITV